MKRYIIRDIESGGYEAEVGKEKVRLRHGQQGWSDGYAGTVACELIQHDDSVKISFPDHEGFVLDYSQEFELFMLLSARFKDAVGFKFYRKVK